MQELSWPLRVPEEESSGLSCEEVSLGPGTGDLWGPEPQESERDRLGVGIFRETSDQFRLTSNHLHGTVVPLGGWFMELSSSCFVKPRGLRSP